MKFKSAIFLKPNSPLVIDDLELLPLSVGQVLVKVITSGICGAQLQELRGYKAPNLVPRTMGHEGVGIVYEVGQGVKTVKPGDKVVLHWRQGEGIESDFPTYLYKGSKITSGKLTTLSTYSVVSENRTTKVDEDADNDLCALLGCALTTALGIVNNDANIKIGETVLVLGAGGVGLHLIQAANLVGAGLVCAADIISSKQSLVNDLNAKFINLNTPSSNNELFDLLQKVDVILDTVGVPDLFSRALPLLSKTGRYILVAQPKPDQNLIIPHAISLFGGIGQTIRASQGGQTVPQDDIPRYVNLNKLGKLNIKNNITHRYSLESINDAFSVLQSGEAGRILIDL